MTNIENLINEDYLNDNIKGAAYFILLYEYFKKTVVESVKAQFSDCCIANGKFCYHIDREYLEYCKKKSRNRNSPIPYGQLYQKAKVRAASYQMKMESLRPQKRFNVFLSSLEWLVENNVFSRDDVKTILKIRDRRNDVVHNLYNVLADGLCESDAQNIAMLLEYYFKLDEFLARKETGIDSESVSEIHNVDSQLGLV